VGRLYRKNSFGVIPACRRDGLKQFIDKKSGIAAGGRMPATQPPSLVAIAVTLALLTAVGLLASLLVTMLGMWPSVRNSVT
jgi:hypothetical protein